MSKTNTLSFKLWLYFVAFAITLFVILWFMQVIFLQSYYSSMKQNELMRLGIQTEQEYGKTGFYDYLDSISYKNACSIFLFDSTGDVEYTSYNNIGGDPTVSPFNNRAIRIDTTEVLDKLQSSATNSVTYTIKIDKFKAELFVYASIMESTGDSLIMVTPIDPIDATTNVLQNQLVYITIIALGISSVISIFISRRLSRPIVKITDTAKKLAKGCYDIEFEKAGYMEADDLADTLNYATKELATTDKVRKELIANVSHDLRTPLTMIKAYSEMIRDLSGDDKKKREEHIDIIIEETDRLNRLVSDMMDLSQIESGFSKLNKTRFNLREIVENMINSFKVVENEDKKTSRFKISMSKEVYVMADKTKIEQVLYNLIANAVNHTPDDKKIEVKVTTFSKRVKVFVIDSGEGIAKDDLQHIWNRYYKVDKTFKRPNSGTGLGLSISKNILDKHKSNYGVKSELTKGSTFWFDLEKS